MSDRSNKGRAKTGHFKEQLLRHAAVLVAILLSTSASYVGAETAYVTDQGEFHLRTGESTQHKIIRVLPSGAQVDVLGQNQETGYSRVRLPDGTTGFILTRYLQSNPAARIQIAEMRERLEALQQEPDQLVATLSQIEQDHELLKREFRAVSERNLELQEALAELEYTSENSVRINEERNKLQQEVAEFARIVGELEQSYLNMRSGNDRQWFLAGAGVAGGGLLTGIILSGFGRRRTGSRDLF